MNATVEMYKLQTASSNGLFAQNQPVQSQRLRLLLSCPDIRGIIGTVSSFLEGHGARVVEAQHFVDPQARRLFLRNEIEVNSLSAHKLRFDFVPIANRFCMQWRLDDSREKKRVVILVSQYDHCLADLLTRWRNQEFAFDIPCVISNHENLRGLVEWHGIPFHFLPVTKQNKQAVFAEIASLFTEYRGDLMVLARYMQILPEELCLRYPNRIINIHHSFLPAFVGAQPYHQAFERGVKMIGATCHYVTADLDQGPIIEQDTRRIDHADTVEDLVRYGRDIERQVLARGLRCHIEDRVVVTGNKTIVFG